MARIRGAGGYPITQASVSTCQYEVGYRGKPQEFRGPTEDATQITPVKTQAAKSLTVANVVYDTLQTGGIWRVTAAAPATSSSTTLYVDPTAAALPIGTVLLFPSGTATVVSLAPANSRALSVSVTGTIDAGDSAITETPQRPAQGPWKLDDVGYNWRFDLPADELPTFDLDDDLFPYPEPWWSVISIKLVPTTGPAIGWEYHVRTEHWLFGKWEAAS